MITLQEWETRIEELINSKPDKEGKELRSGVEFAKKAHAGAYRKNTNEPYIVHPYEVCLIAATVTDDIDVLIGALLHDVVEDTEYTIEDIRANFNERVTSFVADESEDKMEDIPKSMSWLIRKERFIEHLNRAPKESKTICLGDKISNLRSTAAEYKAKGDLIWDRFNQKDPKRHAWYYRNIAEAISDDFEGTKAFEEYKELFFTLFGIRIGANKYFNGGMTMEVYESRNNQDSVIIKITGRVTSTNADDMYTKIKEISSGREDKEYIIDLDGLEMISSAGLRVFLKIKKEKLNFKIINASSDVYDVFDMTGFVQMLDIKKAYRKFSVDGCEIIGEGAKGVVYDIDGETIIKVYKNSNCMDDIVKERECAKKALVMGVPTAIPFDIVLVGENYGSVFELVNAKSVTGTIIDEPEKMEEVVREYARLMRAMHEVSDDGSFGIALPHIKDEVKEWALFAKDYVDEKVYANIEKYVADMEDDNTLLHGDGHPNNVMCTRDEMIFIDMDTLCTGSKFNDIAIVYTALIGYKIANKDDDFIPMSAEDTKHIWNIFIDEYMEGVNKEDVELYCRRFCALRLFRRGIRKMTDMPSFAENMKKELIEVFS